MKNSNQNVKKKVRVKADSDVHGAACGSAEAVDDGIASKRGGADSFHRA